MADIAVGYALDTLRSLITAETSLVSDLSDELKTIRDELKSIQACLISAEEKAQRETGVKQWLKDVRNMAYEIEDVIEEYKLYQDSSLWRKMCKHVSLDVHTMATAIKSICKKTIDIRARKDQYSLHTYVPEQGSSSSQNFQSAMSALGITEESELAGAEIPKSEITAMLDIMNFDSSTTVIAVTGMTGIGKTTIVGSIYKDQTLREYFFTYAWISLSQPYNDHQAIPRRLMQQFREAEREYERTNYDHINNMDDISLTNWLKKYLEDKRYLVVFDGVQEGDTHLGDFIRNVLPSTCNGSKILITSRFDNVAHAWGHFQCALYKLQALPSHKAWELFCKKTFLNSGGHCPPLLRDLAEDFVEQCDGLPSAILGLGRLLSTKQNSLQEWEKVHESIKFYLRDDPHITGIKMSLLRGYYDLPYHLKPCILYFGMFPRKYIIERMKVIRLWMAEGFIQSRDDLTLEEVAEEYLNNLINRNLISVERKDSSGNQRCLRINNVLREIILSKLDELSFCKILSNKNCVDWETRRLSIHEDFNFSRSTPEIIKGKSRIRTILMTNVKQEVPPKVLSGEAMRNLLLLRILDMQNVPIQNVPSTLGELSNLRYLSLRNTKLNVLSRSIGQLRHLQTLDLKHTPIQELPAEISQLHELRHLLAYSYVFDPFLSLHTTKAKGVKLPKGALVKLEALQKLAFIDVQKGAQVLQELKKLTKIRRLGIINLKSEDGKTLCDAIQCMNRLQALNVYSRTKDEVIDLMHVIDSLPSLQRMYLNGQLSALPGWISKNSSLVKVRLRFSRLRTDPFEILEQLPHLVEVELLEAFDGNSLRIENVGLKKLKILKLLDLPNLASLSIKEGALPVLKELSIGQSLQLGMPYGMQFITSLERLEFYGMPQNFTDSIRPGNPYYFLVEHVPDVYCHYDHAGQGQWQTYTLR